MRRYDKLRQALEGAAVDALLITGPENRRYLSGFSGSTGWLVVTPDRLALITDGRYWAQAVEEAPDWDLVRFRVEEHARLGGALAELLQGWSWSGRLGFEQDNLSYSAHRQLQEDLGRGDLIATGGLVEKLREVKEPGELQALRAVAEAADRAFLKVMEQFREGVRERDLCAELEYQMQKQGARKPSFDSIVASGPNGAYPHAGVTDRVIGPGELVTMDFGALLDGYASDITRTVWLGQPDELSRRVYRVVREAQSKALEGLSAGRTAAEIDGLARGHICQAGFGDAFSHSLGHGIGLAVHEGPTLRSTVDTVLEPGMVVTVEPGIYLPGQTGCRVEDTVIITQDGFEYVTHSPYQEPGQAHPLG